MSFRNHARRIIAFTLIAALVPAPGLAWRAPLVRPHDAGAPATALDARAFLDALNAAPQAIASGRPQIYLVFGVDVNVPASDLVAITDWLDDFLAELSTASPVTTQTQPTRPVPPLRVLDEKVVPFCNVPCLPARQPVESILDDIEEMETHVRSMPSAKGLAAMPDSLPFERNPNETVPVERSMGLAIEDALFEAGFENPGNNGSSTFKRGTETVTYEGQATDGDIIVTGRLVDGRIVLTKEFKPLTGSGDVGEPVRIRSTSRPPSVVQSATVDPPASPADTASSTTALPFGARAIPAEAVRQWGLDFHARFAGQTSTITGERDGQGRLLDMNGQVVAPTVLAALRVAQAGAVRDLNGFVGDLQSKLNMTRDQKVLLAKDLQAKATAVRAASDALATARDTYRTEMARYQQIWKNDSAAAARFEAEQIAKLNAAKAAYANLLTQTPLLTIKRDGVMLWEALTGDGRPVSAAAGADNATRIAADQTYVQILNPYLSAGIDQTNTQAAEIKAMDSLEDLALFATPGYAGLRERIALMGKPIGSTVPAELMAELEAAGNGALKSWTGEALSRIIDKGLIVIGVGGIFLPFGPLIALGVSAIQVYRSGGKTYIAYGQAADAEGRVAATGYEAVMNADAKLAMASGELFFDVSFGALDILAALKYAEAVQIARAEKAGDDALAAAIPRGATPVSSAVDNASGILNRIDMTAKPRVGQADAAFFRGAGLEPQRTVQIGGQTFHLSRPFRGPGDRIGIIAFQETADGKIIPRTFYLSGEHGLWRAASAGGGGLQKGPVKYYTDNPDVNPNAREITQEEAMTRFMEGQGYGTKHVNESAVDIAGELQGSLHRWRAESGVIDLDADVARRAFVDHLEDARGMQRTEFEAFVKPEDIQQPFRLSSPGSMPDFGTGPLDRWTFNHPFYGNAEGFWYKSVDGETLFLVVRDQNGRVFVPSIQDGSAGVTPFGTRTAAVQSDLTTTPIQHAKGQNGTPVPGNDEYVDVGTAYQNPLNNAFGQNLPPRAATTSTSTAPVAQPSRAQDATPTVIEPGRQPRTGTFGPGGRAVAGLGGDEILHVNALADARKVREGNLGGLRAWTGQELERLRILRNDPTQFRNEYGGKLSQQDLDAIDTLLKHFRVDPATGQRVAAAAGIAAPASAGALGNNRISENSDRTADRLAEAVIDHGRRGVPTSQLVAATRTALGQTGITPQRLVTALRHRLTSPLGSRTVSMAELGVQGQAAPAPVAVELEALGVSSGDAFTLKALNRTNLPVALRGEGIVVEPVPGNARTPATSTRGTPAVTQSVEAFCLERERPVATQGTAYRVAPPAVQAQHRGLVSLLHAAKRVADAGGLRPDSEFKGYFNFVRQWAIWTKQENFDEKQFTTEFLNLTKKNVEGQGMKWTRDMDDVVRKAAPGRWQDINAILNEGKAPQGVR